MKLTIAYHLNIDYQLHCYKFYPGIVRFNINFFAMTRVFHFACLILTYFGLQQRAQASVFINAKTAVETGIIVRDNVNFVKDFFTGGKPHADTIKPEDVRMLNTLYRIESSILNLKEQLFQKIAHNIESELNSALIRLNNDIDQVNDKYVEFMDIVNNPRKYNLNTIKDHAKNLVSSSLVEFPELVKKLHKALYQPIVHHFTILSILSEGLDNSYMCAKNQSPQQMISELYKSIVYADLKSVAVRIFARAFNGLIDNTSYQWEIDQEVTKFQDRVDNSYKLVVAAMKKASRDIWRCDPIAHRNMTLLPNHQRGQTYATVQEIFQSVLVFERDIEKSCYPQCSEYTERLNSCKSQFCKNQKKSCKFSYNSDASGIVRDCMDMSNNFNVCYAPPNSERQYDWAKTDGDLIYGRDRDFCSHKLTKLSWEYPKFEDIDRPFVGPWRLCNYCLCTCEDLTPARTRYFELSTSTSATHLNKVITGVRFRKLGYVYYIQIQQGKLGPNGTIESADWIPDYYHNTRDNHGVTELNLQEDDVDPPFYKVSWETRTVYLDEIVNNTHPNKVLTGLKFKKVGRDMRLEAQLTEFDYATGKLGKSQWFFNPATRDRRTAIFLDNTDDPTRHFNDAIYSRPGSYVQFVRTDMVKDMGQLTVPFLEMQDVVSDPPVPITGVSLFLKATPGSGGFLAFKLTQYDVSRHL